MTETVDIRTRYAAGGLMGRLTRGTKFGLLVVDFQTGFTDPACAPGFNLDAEVDASAELLRIARAARVPVYYTVIGFSPEELERGSVWLEKMPALRSLELDSTWVDVDGRLAPRNGDRIYVKTTASAFNGTRLQRDLAADGVDAVVIVGATTSGCVRASVVDACAADIAAYVVREGVGDREAAPAEAAFLDIEAKYGQVINRSDAAHLFGRRS